MTVKTEKAQSTPLTINWYLVFFLTFLYTVGVIISRGNEALSLFQPMHFFIAGIVCVTVSLTIAVFASYKRAKYSSLFNNAVKVTIAFTSAAGLFFTLNWILLLILDALTVRILAYQLALGVIALLSVITEIVSDDVVIFGMDMWTAIDYSIAGLCIAALAAIATPNSLAHNDFFPVLFLFSTVPFLLSGILAFRNKHQEIGILLCAMFVLPLFDLILVTSGIMIFRHDLFMQIVIIGAVTCARWVIDPFIKEVFR
jgi:hypothetical protein